MNRETAKIRLRTLLPLLAIVAWPVSVNAQVAEAQIEEIEELPVISSSELEELIGPIALYPDDLLAIVLPATTFPLQIVEAARFLEALEDDPSLEPDPDWDDSIVALLNYPEVVALLNEDLDRTWRLGEAVVAQQSDVIAAIELFRDRAYAAGNLESDDYQLVSNEGGSIQITPVEEDVIHVPYYEPEQVVVYQPRPVYYYYPRTYPVYYYPYPSYYVFDYGPFWGVTTAFSIGWNLHHLSVYHHSFFGHPYYGYTYWDRWWYRRPDINVYNNYYVRNYGGGYDRYRYGDRWYPNVRRTIRQSDQRVTRTRYYPGTTSGGTRLSQPASVREVRSRDDRADIPFRERSNKMSGNTNPVTTRPSTQPRTSGSAQEIRFRERPDRVADSSGRSRVATGTPTRTSQSTRSSEARLSPSRTTQSRLAPSRTSQPTVQSMRRSEPRVQPSRTTQSRVAPARTPQPSLQSTRSAQPRSVPSRSSQPRSQPSRSSQPKAQTSRQSQSRSESSRSSRSSRSGSDSRNSSRRR